MSKGLARMNELTLVIAWDMKQRGPLAVRFAANLRHARKVGEELWEEYPWAQRISYVRELDYLEVPEAPPFLDENGWDVEWRVQQLEANAQIRAEEKDDK